MTGPEHLERIDVRVARGRVGPDRRAQEPTTSVPSSEPDWPLSIGAGLSWAESAPTRVRRSGVVPTSEPLVPREIRRSAVIQRMAVAKASVRGLAADFDTDNLKTATAMIRALDRDGRRDGLTDLDALLAQDSGPHRQQLRQQIQVALDRNVSDEPATEESGWLERVELAARYLAADTSDPAVRDGLRMWISGDPARGIGWNIVGQHLRGTLSAAEYQAVGNLHFMRLDQEQNLDGELTAAADHNARDAAARLLLDAVANDIRGALAALPGHDGISYRQAGVANSNVYESVVNVGDVLRDTAFWSTSALRISGSAGQWGQNGTLAAPKVFFLISGSTGRYISKYAAQEAAQHEVLFSTDVCFRVTRIANYGGHTFFVELTEVPPVGPLQAKNPYDGSAA